MTTATAERSKRRQRSGTALDIATLKAAMSAVSSAISNRSPRAILKNVRLGDGMLVGSSDELRIEIAIDYTGDPVLLPYARLSAILHEFKVGEMRINPNGTSCKIKAGAAEWTIPTEDPAEFPGRTVSDAPALARIPCDQFARAVRAVQYAVDNESSRFALGAICIDVKGGVVTLVGTDGRRLSAAEIEIDQAVDDAERLVPVNALTTIRDLCDGLEEDAVQLDATESELIATLPNATIIARLVSGRFPRWRDVLVDHETSPTTATIAELRAATRAAAIVTSEQSKGVTYTFSGDTISLHGQSSEAGTSNVTCPVVEAGHACKVKLDPKFVVDYLDGLPPDGEPTVSIQAKDSGSAVAFRCDDYTGLVMPLSEDA